MSDEARYRYALRMVAEHGGKGTAGQIARAALGVPEPGDARWQEVEAPAADADVCRSGCWPAPHLIPLAGYGQRGYGPRRYCPGCGAIYRRRREEGTPDGTPASPETPRPPTAAVVSEDTRGDG